MQVKYAVCNLCFQLKFSTCIIDERPFLLKDDEYEVKYRIELETAVFRAMENPQALFRGYDICVADHVQPPASTISKIATCAGGKVS